MWGACLEEVTILHHSRVVFKLSVYNQTKGEFQMKEGEEIGRKFLKAPPPPPKATLYGKFLELWALTFNVRVARSLAGGESLQMHSGQKCLPLYIQKNRCFWSHWPVLHHQYCTLWFHPSLVLSPQRTCFILCKLTPPNTSQLKFETIVYNCSVSTVPPKF